MRLPELIRRRSVPGLIVVTVCLCGVPARADVTLWYNGNFNGVDATSNQQGGLLASTLIYDDFVVPVGFSWTLSGVFSNNMLASNPTSAHWEIRSGLSAGNGGTLRASGNNAATLTPTGNTLLQYTESKVAVSNLNVTLGAGTYWLSVAPIATGGNVAFLSMTSGAGAIGSPPGNDGNSFGNSSDFGWNFLPTSDNNINGPGTWDYSMGVVGVATPLVGVPEPSVLSLAGLLGAAGLAGLAFRRRRVAA